MLLQQTKKTMNSVTEKLGLSARQKIKKNSRNYWFPSSATWLVMVLTLIISSCDTRGQDGQKLKEKSATTSDSLNKPKVNIKVNKHYDDKGNVIGFDSTYTSFYSNVEGDTARMDSLMRSFDRHFNLDKTSLFSRELDSLFFNESLRYPDFFHDDFFLKRYELNDSYFRDMMHRMDSLKNNFYKQHSLRERGDESRDL